MPLMNVPTPILSTSSPCLVKLSVNLTCPSSTFYSRVARNHIQIAFQKREMRTLVYETPVGISGEDVATIISLDGSDVDDDLYIFLEHSFEELQIRYPKFPLPTEDQLSRLASRAGRRLIVASTMMKFIDDKRKDPRDRLELMLELASNLLPGTEVYELYDCVLSTCANPTRAYQHLSIVATLADPLPMPQISELLGLGEGVDVEMALVQLRSIIDIPTDSSLPVQISHSSAREYASDPSKCGLKLGDIPSPHSLLAQSSFHLIIQDIQKSTALLDALLLLKSHSPAVQSDPLSNLEDMLDSWAVVGQPEPLQVLTGLL
jgi:hypothetical protein